MEFLTEELSSLIQTLGDAERDVVQERLSNLASIYPFNEYEFIISHLLGLGALDIDGYIDLRDEYISRNLFLYIFEIAGPRTFGEQWAQGHLKSLVPSLEKPTKRLDPNYNSGEYDFLLQRPGQDPIRIEVKASRAVDKSSREPLFVKALSSTQSDKQFVMNFQQVKPNSSDVFVWIGVWRDVIRFWVLSSAQLRANKHYSIGQHRGNIGEGQLHLTNRNIGDFAEFEVDAPNLLIAILRAAESMDR